MPIRKNDNPRTTQFEQALRKVEQVLEAPVFSLVSDSSIERTWVAEVYAARKDFNGLERITILLDSPGGDLHSTYRMVRLFRHYFKEMRVIVPLWAKSAATLFCLGADEIFMTPVAELGPMDTQLSDPRDKSGRRTISSLEGFKALDFLRIHAWETIHTTTRLFRKNFNFTKEEALSEARQFIAAMMEPLYSQVNPRDFGSYSRSLETSEEYAKRILKSRKIPDEATDDMIKKLVWAYPSHGFAIDWAEAKDLGLNVKLLEGPEGEAISEMVPILDQKPDGRNDLEYIGFLPKIAKTAPVDEKANIADNR